MGAELVEVALLDTIPFWSTPVSENVYVLAGVVTPSELLVGVLFPQAGISKNIPAITNTPSNPNARRARLFRDDPTPSRRIAGTGSHSA